MMVGHSAAMSDDSKVGPKADSMVGSMVDCSAANSAEHSAAHLVDCSVDPMVAMMALKKVVPLVETRVG